jgi:hypothetical protein
VVLKGQSRTILTKATAEGKGSFSFINLALVSHGDKGQGTRPSGGLPRLVLWNFVGILQFFKCVMPKYPNIQSTCLYVAFRYVFITAVSMNKQTYTSVGSAYFAMAGRFDP